MKTQLNLLLILISFSFSTILNVNGEEYTTIQSAIDDAETGDTVLVHQGLYYENLDINKTITLTSLAMYDNLDTWYDYESLTHQYEINNDNILNTIIDASQATDENFTSGIVVRSPEDDCIAPVIMGFTIRGGMGTMVTEDTEEGEVDKLEGLVTFADSITVTADTTSLTMSFNLGEGMSLNSGGADKIHMGSGPFQAIMSAN